MRQFCLAALSLVAAAGCYSDAPPQSTFPEPQSAFLDPRYISGPPGSAIDPDGSYAPYGGAPAASPGMPGREEAAGDAPDDPDDEGDAVADDAPAAPEAGPMPGPMPEPTEGSVEGSPGSPGSPGPSVAGIAPGVPDADGDGQPGDGTALPDAAADPIAAVTDAEIDTTLDGYGQWVETADYGDVWRPDATVVGVDFTPYESGGSWAYTDAGWAFSCEYPWGWLPFHYGRWAWLHDYWAWVPGHRWGPAWVQWRHGGGVVGWRPIQPRVRDHRPDAPGRHHHGGSTVVVRDHRRAEQHDAHWRFATVSDFARPHVRAHLYGNLAEGLRVTSTVKALPVHARVAVHAADLMRNRGTGGVRFSSPGTGRASGPVRDHRGVYGVDRPSQISRPPMYQPSHRPVRTYQSPVRTYQPPVQTYQPPVRTYQPPVRTYQPPVRTYQPPVRTYQPPVRTYQPPVRTFQPPVQTNQPPVRTYQPPVRTYTPSSPPPHASNPPSHAASPPASSSGSSGSHSDSSGSSPASGSHRGDRRR